MPLDDSIRDRVLFLGGKAAGVSCPNCQFTTREVDLDAHSLSDVTCPECGTTILSKEQQAQLRQADKF